MNDQLTKTRQEIINALRMGVCSIIYTKIDGETRVSVGTLDGTFIPEEKMPKQKEHLENGSRHEQPKETNLVHYYDIMAKGWRCFLPENLTSLTIG